MISHVISIHFIAFPSTRTALQLKPPQSPPLPCRRNISFPANSYPLKRRKFHIPINEKIMKYFVYLNNKDNDSIVKQSFLMSKNLYSVKNSGFYSNLMNMVQQNNPSTLDPNCLGIINNYSPKLKMNTLHPIIYTS